MKKTRVHFADKYLLQPTNSVTVNVIGMGGTGSQVLTNLARINQSLNILGHAGLFVTVFDDDVITEANRGRLLFTNAETALNKGVAFVNRINRFFGTNWKAVQSKFHRTVLQQNPKYGANVTISCVDNVSARFEIADAVCGFKTDDHTRRPIYWMDFGNSKYTGQVILSTIGTVSQPKSKKYEAVETLPFVTDEFKGLLMNAERDDTPSCSLAEALGKQDLFINACLADEGANLLWRLFREGMTENRGFFKNLMECRTQAVKV